MDWGFTGLGTLGAISAAGPGIPLPAGPSAPSFALAQGVNAGEVTLTLTGAPSSLGDGAVFGDGLGVLTDYQYQYPGYAWTSLSSTALGSWLLTDGLIPGEVLQVRVRALGTAGRTGAASSYLTVTVPGPLVKAVAIYQDEGFLIQDGRYVMQFLVDGPAVYINAAGNDTTGTGAESAPFATLAKALTVVGVSGTIRLSSDIVLPDTASATGITISIAGLTIESDRYGVRRKLDMSLMMSSNTTVGDGISFRGAGQTVRGIRFSGYKPKFGGTPSDYVAAVNIRGADCLFENCAIDGCSGRGLSLGEGGTPTNARIFNNDFHDNLDPQSGYGNADGLQGIWPSGATGIRIEGNRFWGNSDDGLDLFYAQAPAIVRGNWAFSNGFRENGTTLGGDGCGLKLGGNAYTVAHTVEENLVFDNAGGGISTNDNQAANAIRRNTEIRNGRAGNGYPASTIADGSSIAILEDNVKYGGYPNYLGVNVVESYNSWNTPPGIGAESAWWFVSLNTTGVTGPRKLSGALPVLPFGRPAAGSPLLTGGHAGGHLGWTKITGDYGPAIPTPAAKLMLLLLTQQ